MCLLIPSTEEATGSHWGIPARGAKQEATVNLEDKGALAKLVEAIRTNYNDRYNEIRCHWRSNVLGPKSVANIAKRSLALSPGWSAVAQSRLTATSVFPVSSNSPASASRVAGTTGMHHHVRLIFCTLVETGFHRVGQDGLDLLTRDHPPAPKAGIGRPALCHLF
ncbi:60S ribosomal protein L7a [Plecturocebus cupreus]